MSDGIDDIKVGGEPMDRLTELAQQMSLVLEEAGNEDVKAILFLNDKDRGGIQFHGYEDPTSGMADLFVHLRAVFKAQGKQFGIMNEDGVMML